MTGLIRLWDKDFKLLGRFEGDDFSELMSQVEAFIHDGAFAEAPYYTIDPNWPETIFATRIGGRIVTTETGGFRWEDNRDYLRYLIQKPHDPSRYALPRHVGPGDKISVKIGDQIYTDTIESIRAETPKREPVPAPRRPWWRRVLRALTPRRYREPDLWVPPGGGTASTVITTVGDGPPYQLGRDIVLGERQDLTDPAYWTDRP